MGIPRRWHIARSGQPQFRSAAVAIALVIVGSMLLETGAVARTPIESTDSPAPIAALIGPGDAFVAMAYPGRDVSVAPAIRSRVHGRAGRALDSAIPDAAHADGAAPPGRSVPGGDPPAACCRTSAPCAVDPWVPAPGAQAQLLLAAFEAQELGLRPLRTRRPRAAVQARGQRHGTHDEAPRRQAHQAQARPLAGVPHGHLVRTRLLRQPDGVRPALLAQHRGCRPPDPALRHARPVQVARQEGGGAGHRSRPVRSPRLVFDFSAWLACRTFRPHGARNGCFTRANVHYRVVGKVNLKAWFKDKKAQKRKRAADRVRAPDRTAHGRTPRPCGWSGTRRTMASLLVPGPTP